MRDGTTVSNLLKSDRPLLKYAPTTPGCVNKTEPSKSVVSSLGRLQTKHAPETKLRHGMYVPLPRASCRHRGCSSDVSTCCVGRRISANAPQPAALAEKERVISTSPCTQSCGRVRDARRRCTSVVEGSSVSSRRRIVATPGRLPELQAVGHSRLAAPHSALLAPFWGKAFPPMLTLTRLHELGQTAHLPGEVRRFSLQL